MNKKLFLDLSRRERQIMDSIFQLGEATAKEIMEKMPLPPTYAAVRRMIAILEEKGFLVHRVEGIRYVYTPVVSLEKARKSAISHLTETFFKGSSAQAAAAILNLSSSDLTEKELDELSRMIEQAKLEGR